MSLETLPIRYGMWVGKYLPWVLFGIFFLFSGLGIFLVSGEMYARSGSLFVALSIILFGLRVNFFRRVESELLNSRIDLAQNVAIVESFQNSMKIAEKAGLTNRALDEDWLGIKGHAEMVVETTGNLRNTFEDFEKQGRWKELTVGFFASVMWGYGDLFHCWIKGNGWTTC